MLNTSRTSAPARLNVAADASRRRWYSHWLRPGNDTPLGYYTAHFGYLVLLLFGLQTAVLGRGWHFRFEEVVAVLVDGSWLVRNLVRKTRRGRPVALTPRARGEVRWIDTPESRTGVPLD